MKNKVLCIFLTFVMILSYVTIPASAEVYEGKSDSISWSFDEKTGILTVSGSGAVSGNYWSQHQDYITEVVIEEGITALSTEVLSKHYYLKTVHLPSTLTYIGASVFLHSDNLSSIVYAGSEEDWHSNVEIDYYIEYNPIFNDMSCFTFLGTAEEKIKIEYFYDINTITTDQYVSVALPTTVTGVTENGDEVLASISYTAVDFSVAGEHKITAQVTIPDGYCMSDGEESVEVQFSVIVNEAPSGTCGANLNWIIKNGTLEITGSGDMYEYDNTISGKEIPWKDHAAKINRLSLPTAMSSISKDFVAGTSVSDVDLPSSVSKIADGAFRGTTSLTVIYGNDYFVREHNGFALYTKDMKKLVTYALKHGSGTSHYLPSGVEEIAPYAYQNSGIGTIYVPASVTTVGTAAFDSTTNLVGHINSATAQYASANGNSFSETYIRYIQKPADITVTVGDSLTLPAITTATLTTNETVTVSLSYDKAPDTSTAHTEVISASVTAPENINNSITSVTFNLTVETPSYSGTDGTVTWLLKDGVLTLSGSGDMGADIPWAQYIDEIKTVAIGSGITYIPDGAFAGANLETITSESTSYTVTNGILFCGNTLFCYPAKLAGTEYTVADSITAISAKAFYNASLLETITVRNTVTTIGENAFSGTTATLVVDGGSAAHTHAVNNALSFELIPAEIIEEGSYGDISFTVDANYHMVISGTGTLKSYTALEPENIDLVKSITVEEGITGDNNYFTAFNAVESISFPASATSMSNFLLEDIPSLKSVSVASGNTKYYSVDGVLYDKSTNAMVYYPSGKEDSVFVLPETTEKISTGFVGDCPNLKEIKIGKNVTAISSNMENCLALEKITVDAENSNYSSLNGVLYNKNQTTLLKVPVAYASESFAVPSTVTSIDAKAFYNNRIIKTVEMTDSVTTVGNNAFSHCINLDKVTLSNKITNIPYECFYYSDSLTQINMPTSLLTIGSDAFYRCQSLLNVTFPESLEAIYDNAFAYCYELTEIAIPAGTYVDYSAFTYCTGLSKLTLSEGITEIGSGAFSYCYALAEIKIPSTLTVISDRLFHKCVALENVTIPQGVTTIGDSAFSSCAIKSLVLPSTISSIGSSAFYQSSLTQISIPAGITTIESSTFSGCSSLTSVALPDSVTSIGSSAFYKCSELSQINIPAGVTSIGDSAFYGCSSLTSLTLPSNVTSLGTYAFYNCSALETVNIPEGVTTIGISAFRNCAALKSIELPSSVTAISDYAFYGCTALETINIPNGVSTISAYSFRNCDALKTIELPDSVTTIANYAFYDCAVLEKVVIPATVTSISSYSFKNCPNLVIYGEQNSYAHTFATENSIPFVYEQKKILSVDDTWNNLSGANLIVGDKYTLPETATATTNNSDEPLTLSITYDSTLDTSYAHTQNITATLVVPQDYQLAEGVTTEKVISFTISYPSAEGKLNNISWSLSNRVLTISGTGAMPDFVNDYAGNTDVPWYEYREYIDSIVIESGITAIGDYSFYQLRLVQDISIPEGVTSIGDYAFSHSASDINQVELTLPSTLNTLGTGALENMALYSITLPSGITTLPADLFYKCPYLSTVTIEGIITNIGESAFYGAPVSEVYFRGTTEQWNSVVIAEKGNEDFIGGATIYCNDPIDITLERPAVDYKVDYSTQKTDIVVEVPKSAVAASSSGTAEIIAIGIGSNSHETLINTPIKENGSYDLSVSTENVTEIKIFIWESLESMKPIALPVTIKVPSAPSGSGSSSGN